MIAHQTSSNDIARAMTWSIVVSQFHAKLRREKGEQVRRDEGRRGTTLFPSVQIHAVSVVGAHMPRTSRRSAARRSRDGECATRAWSTVNSPFANKAGRKDGASRERERASARVSIVRDNREQRSQRAGTKTAQDRPGSQLPIARVSLSRMPRRGGGGGGGEGERSALSHMRADASAAEREIRDYGWLAKIIYRPHGERDGGQERRGGRGEGTLH